MSHTTFYYLSSLLRNCVLLSAISQAKQAHVQILVHGFLNNVTLQTDLLLVYSKCGVLQDARRVFDNMSERNMHTWNILLAAYAQNFLYLDAMSILREFLKVGLRPDHYTLPPAFKACAGIQDACQGKMLHGWVVKRGYEDYLVVGSSVLDFYVKCGNLVEAIHTFSRMSFRDSAVWNSMISGFGRAGYYVDALNYLRAMLTEGANVDSMTIPSILNACGGEGDLMKGKEIHGQVVKRFIFDGDVTIGNSLIDMYAKCGCLHESVKVFQNMPELNLVTWTTMISAYGAHGKGEDSLALYEKMRDCGFEPNCVTLTAVLASCSHSGLIDQGWRIFNSISFDFGLEPSVEHYACMVDLLGRFGHLEEALGLIRNMKSEATASVWGALLAGCMMHKNVELGEMAALQLFKLEPRNSSNYIALCSIYDSLGIWDGVSLIRAEMRNLGLAKTPGCSWITIAGKVNKFYQGDHSHPQILKEYEMLYRLMKTAAFPGNSVQGNCLSSTTINS